MKLIEFLKDKYVFILSCLVSIGLIFLIMYMSNSNIVLIYTTIFILVFFLIGNIIYEYYKKRIFYNEFKESLNGLDKKYLITEIVKSSNFIEGKLLLSFLEDIDKCMHEEINNYKYTIDEFREYLEMWCHEIKLPIATSKLIIDNNESNITKNILEEIEKIDKYVEQVLFYSRSDTVEKDYIITDVNLQKLVNNVIKKNKKMLIDKKIKIITNCNNDIKSDIKWLEFIINQIISNSIKYSKEQGAYIKFETFVNKNNIELKIEDNGIGIEESEVSKVFDKGFTGKNGRKKYNSTGLGLYLCKKLCLKLGINIIIESKINTKTIVTLVFPLNSLIEKVM